MSELISTRSDALVTTYKPSEYWEKLNYFAANRLVPKNKRIFDDLCCHYNNNPYVLFSYMKLKYYMGEFDKVIDLSDKFKTYFSSYNTEILLGDTYRNMHQPQRALIHYETAHYMCPVKFVPLQQIMEIYADNNDSDKAKTIAEEIINKPVKINSGKVEQIKREASGIISPNTKCNDGFYSKNIDETEDFGVKMRRLTR